MNDPLRRLCSITVVSVGLAFALAGCGETVTIIDCPLGTRPQGSQCVPWDDTAADAAAMGDGLSGGDTASASDLPTFPTTDGQPGSGGPDVPSADAGVRSPDVPGGGEEDGTTAGGGGPGAGKVGAPCTLNSECDGGTCLDMPGGYCTFLDCEGGGCPLGSECVQLNGGNTGCYATCLADGDCRPVDQACKDLQTLAGTSVGVCHGVSPDAGGVGALCGGDVDCKGTTLCLATMPGGYCSVTQCQADSCPPGAACVELGGIPTCLRECGQDADCGGAAGAERRCAPLASVAGEVLSVCISGVSGQPIGASCSSDFDCASATCQVLGHGRCSQTGRPCDPEAAAEACGPAEACLDQGQGAIGRCTQPCQTDLGCPGGSFCLGDPGAALGLCRPLCAGLGVSDDCPTADGFLCAFGFALGDTQAQGRYLCDLPASGDVGASCGDAAACGAGSCQSGACALACDQELYCPFPGICVTGGAQATCRKACLSSADCPAGTSCVTAAGALGSFCQ